MTLLEALKQHTTVVADTGDFDLLQQYQPQDATTNPTLLLQAAQKETYRSLVEEAVSHAKREAETTEKRRQAFLEHLAILFGCEILKIVPGRVSTEVDASLSFDRVATLEKARRLVSLYRQRGISTERILIKIGSTWKGSKPLLN